MGSIKSVIVYRPDPKQLSRLLKRYDSTIVAVVLILKDSNSKRLGPIIRELRRAGLNSSEGLVIIRE